MARCSRRRSGPVHDPRSLRLMKGWSRACSMVVGVLLAVGCTAQVVNIEGRRFMNDTVPWTGLADFRYNLTENTQRSYSFGLSGAIQHVRGRHRYFLVNDLASSRVGNNAFLNTGFQHLRYNYALYRRWVGEAFAQTQYNKPLRLDLRATLGAGPRLHIVNRDEVRVNAGTAVMAEYERTTTDEAFLHARSSNYLAATVRFSKITSLTTVVYYQPKLFNASDHRISLESGVLLALTARYTVESRLNLLRDTAQPEGVPGFVYSWNNRFGIRF